MKPMMIGDRPHWEVRFPEYLWPAYEDFRNFLCLAWDHLGLPAPTTAQLEIAHRLQYGADSIEWAAMEHVEQKLLQNRPRTDIIRCYRSLGKSYVTCCFVIWRLMRNPRDEKVLVVSATTDKAKEFVDMAKNLIWTMDELCKWLLTGKREREAPRRDQSDQFDVAYASITQSYSVKARGINGQITGSRATLLVADDIEIPENSKTEEARATILRKVRSDFGPILETEHGTGDLIFLGTPQTEESVYNVLVAEMGFACFTIPVLWPDEKKRKNYLIKLESSGTEFDILAPYLWHLFHTEQLLAGELTDTRFDMEQVISFQSKGLAEFALQYMLDTSLSDAERYPLKQHDLIVFPANANKAPLTIQWGLDKDRKNLCKYANVGFSGDYLIRPLFIDDEWREYESRVMFVDPAGRGKDETAWAIGGQLGGTIYGLHIGAHRGDPAEAMAMIAQDAKTWDVKLIEVEPNYAQGMWVPAFTPIMMRVWPHKDHREMRGGERLGLKEAVREMGGCTIQESEWAKGQKETRIIGTLEPVLASHRFVLSEEVVEQDVKRALQNEKVYSLLYQLTHITHERGALKHDDRVEAVAGMVSIYTNAMMVDAQQARESVLDDEYEQELERFRELHEGGYNIDRGGDGFFITRGRGFHDDGDPVEVFQMWQ